MNAFDMALDHRDWDDIRLQLDAEGYALLPGLLGEGLARELAQRALGSTLWRGALGASDLLYFDTGLPALLEQLRDALYRRLAVIANDWSETLGSARRYPPALVDFLERNRDAGQTRAQSHLSWLGAGDHVLLHQRDEGEQVFPMQVVAVLSEPGVDFQGGEFVMTEQRPRMQSRPMVLPLGLGDVAVIATSVRPFLGASGHYRVNLKHAISRVHEGERIGLELSFHDAPGMLGGAVLDQ